MASMGPTSVLRIMQTAKVKIAPMQTVYGKATERHIPGIGLIQGAEEYLVSISSEISFLYEITLVFLEASRANSMKRN